MSTPPSPTCAHELRPGTVVCLHCRHAALEAAAAHRNRRLAKVGGVATLLAVLAGGGSVALRTVRAAPPTPATTQPALLTLASPMVVAERPTAARPVPAEPTPTEPTPATPATPRKGGAGGLVIAEGRTALRAGVVAIRTGDTVAVHFDTPATRTRRMDKFERIVRETLPAVYGALADSALGTVPAGTLARGGDLLTELPTRGVRLRTAGGATLALWPATRPGRDGPLVVTYRATLLQ